MAVLAGPCSEGPMAGTGGELCSYHPAYAVVSERSRASGATAWENGALVVSGQNKPLFLACAVTASGPCLCRP